jgi:hypothetical protein
MQFRCSVGRVLAHITVRLAALGLKIQETAGRWGENHTAWMFNSGLGSLQHIDVDTVAGIASIFRAKQRRTMNSLQIPK